jgi:hypothetical protein
LSASEYADLFKGEAIGGKSLNLGIRINQILIDGCPEAQLGVSTKPSCLQPTEIPVINIITGLHVPL